MIGEIIAIGNEVVDGTIVNSNASWLAAQLSALGVDVRFHTAVPDESELMKEAFGNAAHRAEIVLVSGGLGPTVDDITLKVAADFFGKPLRKDEASAKNIRDAFARLGRGMTKNQEEQAFLPQGAQALFNSVGTAPGAYYLYTPLASKNSTTQTHFGFFPGVPSEMKPMFHKVFLPLLQSHLGAQLAQAKKRFLKVLRCFGLPEGQMDHELRQKIQTQLKQLGIELGFRVRFPSIDIRLSCFQEHAEEAERILQQGSALVKEKLGDYIFGEGEIKLEEVVAKLLTERKQTLATAESCTGGLLANLITDVPGASEFFLEGVVSYSNQAKQDLLSVSDKTLSKHGAVSSEVALEMARGIQKRVGSDFAIAVTGVAGPGGGSQDKPIGTVHIAVIHGTTEWEKRFRFPFRRDLFKQVVTGTALDRVRRICLKIS